MENKDILERVIQKAIDGGWKGAYPEQSDVDISILWHELNNWEVIKIWFRSIVGDSTWDVQRLIFSNDFAKALWGEEEIAVESGNNIPMYGKRLSLIQKIPCWQYHLQNMVIADDPIKYLKENI